MAEGLIYSADQVEELLKCSVCLDRYTNPRILPCQHTFCLRPCLEGLIDHGYHMLRCPECRIEHHLSFNYRTAESFPPNRTIANFLELQGQQVPAITAGNSAPAEAEEANQDVGSATKCAICEKEETTSKCVHCEKQVCETCKKSHSTQLKFDVVRLVSQLRRGIPKISNSISTTEQSSEQVKQHVEGVKAEVRNTIERYIKEIRDREKLLISELDTFQQGELRNVRLHQENLEVELATISSYCDSTESIVNRPEVEVTDTDLLSYKKQCSEYIEQLRSAENETVAEHRHARFQFNGTPLQSSIVTFGEVLVNSPAGSGNDSNSGTTSNGNQGSNDNTNNHGNSTNNQGSVVNNNRHGGFEDALNTLNVPSTSREHLRSPIGGRRHSLATLSPRDSPMNNTSSYYTQYLNSMNRESPQSQGPNMLAYLAPGETQTSPRLAAALGSGYMFQMDIDQADRHLDDLLSTESFNARVSQRRANRLRANMTSVFTNNPWSERDDPDERALGGGHALTNNSSPPASTGSVSTSAPGRIYDSRPAVSFNIGLDGENNARRGRRRNMRGRGSRNRRVLPRIEPNNNNNAAAGNGESSVPAIREESEPTPSTSTGSTTENQLQRPQLTRDRTFVMEEEQNGNAVSRPTVNGHDTDDDAPPPVNVSPTDSLTCTRPFINYKHKTHTLRRIGGNDRGNEVGKFTWPRGVATSPVNGAIVVADSSNHRVQIFDCNGQFVSSFGSYGHAEGEFDCLSGIAVNNHDHIVVADRYNHRIQVFDRYGTFRSQFGREGTGNGHLKCPWGLAVDSLGRVYVCDKENHRVQIFSADGAFIRKIGCRGTTNGKFDSPNYVTVSDDNKIIVSDTNNHRIQVFDSRGRHQLTFGSEGPEVGHLKQPRGVSVDSQGFILVADSGNNRVQVFRGDGRYFSHFGRYGVSNGEFKGMEGMATTVSGTIIVCDKENHRVQIF